MDITQALIGLKVFARNGSDNLIQAEHDIIYGPYKDSMLLSLAEIKTIEDAGWFIDQYDCWVHYC